MKNHLRSRVMMLSWLSLATTALFVPAMAAAGGRSEARAASATESARPDWVATVISGNIASLYPGPDGGGYVGTGVGGTREEAVAAASVDFAGDVSTVVNASVVARETLDGEGETSFDIVVESQVRSQAVISGLEELTWEDTEAGVHYALIRTTVEDYNRRVADWIDTMEAVSEAERRREIHRLEDQQAAAERRMAEIQINTLEDQVREADRRARAARHRNFLSVDLMAVDRQLPSGYVPGATDISAAYRGGLNENGADVSWIQGLWDLAAIGIVSDIAWSGSGDSTLSFVGTARAHVLIRLLNRVGWVTSSTLSVGAYGGVRSDGLEWAVGAFGVYDILVPELASTRYTLYGGTDALRARVGWYPFWATIEDAFSLDAAVHVALPDGRRLTAGADHTWFSIGIAFRPAKLVRFTLDSRNFNSLRGSVTLSL